MNVPRVLTGSPRSLAAALVLAGSLAFAPSSSQAGCFGCGFDTGAAIGGLAIGALAAGARANERQSIAPDDPRLRGRRPPIVTYDPSDPEAPSAVEPSRPTPAQQARRKAVAQKPVEPPARKAAAEPVQEPRKATRSVSMASTGALEP